MNMGPVAQKGTKNAQPENAIDIFTTCLLQRNANHVAAADAAPMLAKNSRESWPEKHDKYLLQSTDCWVMLLLELHLQSLSLSLSHLSILCNPFAHAWMPLSQRELLNGAKRPVVPADAVKQSSL